MALNKAVLVRHLQLWAVVLASGGGLMGCQTTNTFVAHTEQPVNALIVWCDPVKQTARQIDDPEMVARLQAFFPGYRHLGPSARNSAWLARYIIFINFHNGRSIRLVSDGHVWSGGRGDRDVAGDFVAFVEDMVTLRSPP